jgi:hypothetical protein
MAGVCPGTEWGDDLGDAATGFCLSIALGAKEGFAASGDVLGVASLLGNFADTGEITATGTAASGAAGVVATGQSSSLLGGSAIEVANGAIMGLRMGQSSLSLLLVVGADTTGADGLLAMGQSSSVWAVSTVFGAEAGGWAVAGVLGARLTGDGAVPGPSLAMAVGANVVSVRKGTTGASTLGACPLGDGTAAAATGACPRGDDAKTGAVSPLDGVATMGAFPLGEDAVVAGAV